MNKKNVVPEAREGLNRFKMEAANEVGVFLILKSCDKKIIEPPKIYINNMSNPCICRFRCRGYSLSSETTAKALKCRFWSGLGSSCLG